MIYTYGDSFSYRFWIEEEETYTYKLATKVGLKYENRSFPAICNHEIFQRLTEDLGSFKRGDIIIYQFSAGEREGLMINDGNKYFSSAGISPSIKETRNTLDKYAGGRDTFEISDDNIMLLLSYCHRLGEFTISHKYKRVENLLKFLEKTIGIRYVMLFLDSKFDKFLDRENSINFDDGFSIMDWAIKNKLRLSDTPREGIHENDAHPNIEGHFQISEKIYEHINKKT
jgi:hypothetical protein